MPTNQMESENAKKHLKNLVFMVEPVSFRANEETKETNAFQTKLTLENVDINQLAHQEFKALASTLNAHGVDIHIEKDLIERDTPDSIFPNNWVSFHENGKVLLYPMHAENRRRERSLAFIHQIAKDNQLLIDQVIDLSHEEQNGRYLEGTGSIVFDHSNKKAYACLSERTDETVLNQVCQILNYEPVVFHAYDTNEIPIYHTNVMMAIGNRFAVICSESINNLDERNNILNSLKNDHKEIIEITLDQMHHFCGNIIQLRTKDDRSIIAMSQTAFNYFTEAQKSMLSQHGKLIYSDISTIETHGGGSVRCMICEVS